MKRKLEHYRLSSAGFTLIELLVVIAIIGILAAILTPAARAALERAKVGRAKAEVMSIAAAIKAYNNEYSKLPIASTGSPRHGDNDNSVTGLYASNVCVNIIRVLTDTENATGLNPRRIAFLEHTRNDGVFVDPWGMQYRIKLDTNYDNEIRYTGQVIKAVAIVVSYGSDRVEGGSGRDVTSFD